MPDTLEDSLFFRDDSPDSFDCFIHKTHLLYLHINGELIPKLQHYGFSVGSMERQGGMVRAIWWPGTPLVVVKQGLRLMGYDDPDKLIKRVKSFFTEGQQPSAWKNPVLLLGKPEHQHD